MYHLPKDGARVKVWPDPKLQVHLSPPQEGMAPSMMPASGSVVEWNGFRYRQYLEGLLHFHDPRPAKDREDSFDKFQLDLSPPQHIKDQLKAVALRDGEGLYLDEAKKEQSEEKTFLKGPKSKEQV